MKILLAVDRSKCSEAAVEAVLKQIRPKGTEICVLNVVEPISAYVSADLMPHFVPQIATVEKARFKEAKETVRRVAERLRRAGFRATEAVDDGDPKDRILGRASRWGASLIVMGSHGLTGLYKFLMGSVSEGVMRHAKCSVEVVRVPNSKKSASATPSRRGR